MSDKYYQTLEQLNRLDEELNSSFDIINSRLMAMLDEVKENMNDYLNELIKKDLHGNQR